MPVPPTSPSVGRYPYSYSSYRSSPSSSSPSSSYLGRTTSLDRSSYSSNYGSSYTSSYSSKYSRPPLPSYSSSTDTYRSSRSLRQSPSRPSYSRLISDEASTYTSRFLNDYKRDTSLSRDSGYGGSRFTSRDRSVDVSNGNGFDTSHFGPSLSSYASNYRWDKLDKEVDENGEEEKAAEKVPVMDRIRAFETRSSARERLGLPAGRESSALTSLRDSGLSTSRDSGLDGVVPRRGAIKTYTPTVRTSSAARRSSPDTTTVKDTADENANSSNERRPSVTELARKYDSNHNVTTNGVVRPDDDEDGSDGGSVCSGGQADDARPSIRKRNDSTSRNDQTDSPNGPRVDSPSKPRVESPARTRLDSPTPKESSSRPHRDSPTTNRSSGDGVYSRNDDGRSSPVLNGTIDKDDGSPPRHQLSSSSGSSGTSGLLSENTGLVGLRNIGNTCFMNSVTQCLSNTKYLLEYLLKDGYSSDINTTISTMKGDLIRSFASLLSDMWTEGADTNRALNTGPFKSQIQRFAPVFSGYQQHDAQEFLRKLLEGLHEDVNRVTMKPKPITEDIDDDLDDNQKAMESWKRYLRYDDSKIVDMFVGQLKSSLQCSVCGYSSVTFDPFWDLSLPIPSKSGQVRISQCMDLFTKEEVLDGDERPTCSKCKERRKMTKTFSIQKFPKVLVLHLKRFSPLERWRGKLSCTVEFPLEGLNFSKYTSNSSTSPLYNLIGVANHSGTTYSGHYTAYCKHPYSGTWREYNDSRVSNISQGRICSPEAYVLFYELSSSSSKL